MAASHLEEPYKTLAEALEFEIDPIKNSRFLAFVSPASSEDAANDFIAQVKASLSDARHHCWAYVVRQPERIKRSDDGEPGGSAGSPILQAIQGRGLTDTVVVVVRYFGGVKLGVGGLIRAYGGAAAQALDRAELVTVTPKRSLWIEYQYAQSTDLQAALRQLKLDIQESEYLATVKSRVDIAAGDWDQTITELKRLTADQVTLHTDS